MTAQNSLEARQKKSQSPILWIAIGLSFLPPIAAIFLIVDNPAPYRDAENLINLLEMTFGALALPWVVVAVLLQKNELALQREELSLQRLEVKRLADETNRQATLMNEQLIIERKASFVQDVRCYFEIEKDRILKVIKEIEEIIDAIACKTAGVSKEAIISRNFGPTHIRIVIRGPAESDQKEVLVRFSEVAAKVRTNPRIRRGHMFWQSCQRVGLGVWFRGFLPYALGPITGLTPYQILAYTGVAARAREWGE
jgi:hypothetical protein